MNIKKLVTSGLLIALGVVSSHLIYIPVGPANAFPIQHTITIISAIVLGPMYAVSNAFIISILRNILGLGTLLAFPGSLVGALCAGFAYKLFRKHYAAIFGEVFGTGILGSLLAFPIAHVIMGREVAALFFVVPFLASSLTGALIGYLIIKTKVFSKI